MLLLPSSSSSSSSCLHFTSGHHSTIPKMDPSDFPTSRSPRKELQGPRPPALKIRKDSVKIKKPPVAPQPSQSQQRQQQHPPQHRPPVIIYTVSPKIIHTNPSDFMNLVQRLTGSNSTYNPSNTIVTNSFRDNISSGAISPAARFAAMEKAKTPKDHHQMKQLQFQASNGDEGFVGEIVENIGQVTEMRSPSLFPGILSPAPSSLPPIPPSIFSPAPSDPNPVNFFQDSYPVLHSSRNFMDSSFILPSPSNFISPHLSISPSIDLFNNFFDF